MACDKLIRLDDAIRAVDGNQFLDHFERAQVCAILRRVPSVDSTCLVFGQWIGEGDGYADGEIVYDVWHCSECNHTIDDGTDDPILLPRYCPDCGARMNEFNNTPQEGRNERMN